MSDNDGTTPVDVIDTDDLTAFEADFYQTKVEEKEVENKVEEEVDDTPVDEADDDQDVDSDDSEEDEDKEPELEQKRNRKSAKERISELAHQKNAEREARLIAETRLKALEELMEKQGKKEEPAPAKAPVASVEGPDPDAVDEHGELIYPLGEFDPKYVAALTKHLFQQEANAAKEAAHREAEETKARQEAEQLTSTWSNRLEETEAALPDLREKLSTLETTFQNVEPAYGQYLAETIMKMDRGPEVLYYLANNIDEAQKIVASGHVAATLALGRLEGLMTEPSVERNEKKVSKAPVPPVASRGTAVARAIAPDTDDLDAFELEFYGKRKR